MMKLILFLAILFILVPVAGAVVSTVVAMLSVFLTWPFIVLVLFVAVAGFIKWVLI